MSRRCFILPVLLFLALAIAFPVPASAGGIVLALSGGGARGLAHIGVLEEIEKSGVPVVGIVGTSMGSIIGGLYAAGYSTAELRMIADDLDLNRLLKDRTEPGFSVPDEAIPDRAPITFRREYNKDFHVVGPRGGIRADRLLHYLGHLFARTSVTDFSELPTPFACVATDLETGMPVVLREGSLVGAVRASMSIPGVFTPWTYEGHLLVDGGLVANLPVSIAKHLFPGYPVIAVDVSGVDPTRMVRTVADVIDQTISIMTQQNVQREMAKADLVIIPDTSDVKVLSAPDPGAIVQRGVKAARQALPSLLALAGQAPAAPDHVAGVPKKVDHVTITGLPEEGYSRFRAAARKWEGKPVNAAEIQESLDELMERPEIQSAHFETRAEIYGTDLEIVVQRAPEYELGVSLYTTNQGPNRWLYLRGNRRDLWEQGDTLKGYVAVGEQIGAGLFYTREWDALSQLGMGFSYQERQFTPRGGAELDWKAYNANLGWSFPRGDLTLWLGAQGQYVRFQGDEDWYVGPFASLAWQDLDDDLAPTSGGAAQVDLWLTDDGDLLARGTFLGLRPVVSGAAYFLSGGFELGENDVPYHAAYLGDAEELYSLGNHPLRGDHAAWVRLGRRQNITRSFLGALDTEIFGGYGVTYDDNWDRLADAWELGLALNAPFIIMDSRIFVTYDDNDDWTFGFSLGTPHHRFSPVR